MFKTIARLTFIVATITAILSWPQTPASVWLSLFISVFFIL